MRCDLCNGDLDEHAVEVRLNAGIWGPFLGEMETRKQAQDGVIIFAFCLDCLSHDAECFADPLLLVKMTLGLKLPERLVQ